MRFFASRQDEVLSIIGGTEPVASDSLPASAASNLGPCDFAPNLLLQWESRWRSFLSSTRPALIRHTRPLAVECHTGKFDTWTMSISATAHFIVILALISTYHASQVSQALLRSGERKYEVIYFSGTSLPPLEDRGGALTGVSGRSGGRELKHIQPIRVARGTKVAPSTADAPELKLPRSDKAVANLLAIRPVEPPAPVQALRSMLSVLGWKPEAVPPAPVINVRERRADPLSAEVVPPAPDAASLTRKTSQVRIDAVPAPVSAPARQTNAMARLHLPVDAVPPPPSGIARSRAVPVPISGTPQVAPPPPDVASVNGGTPRGSRDGMGSVEVIPPSPSSSDIGSAAVATALNAVNSAMRAAGIGRTDAAGVIVSAHPGDDVAMPNHTGSGEIALGPEGGDSLGRGGTGDGSGIGNGSGPGNAAAGNGPGSGVADIGPGAAPGRGNSPSPGNGGAGKNSSAATAGGVWVGGNAPAGSVSIPSFATSGNAPTPGHSPNQSPRRHPAVTIVGTSRSGGALNHYGALPGSRVYTVYIDTKGGTAVLEYSAVDPSGREFSQDLVAPEAVSAEVPAELRSASFVVSCVMDRSGLLRNVRVLRNSAPLAATQLVAVLQDWRFRPVLRGDAAIEVHAILGFNVDTR